MWGLSLSPHTPFSVKHPSFPGCESTPQTEPPPCVSLTAHRIIQAGSFDWATRAHSLTVGVVGHVPVYEFFVRKEPFIRFANASSLVLPVNFLLLHDAFSFRLFRTIHALRCGMGMGR